MPTMTEVDTSDLTEFEYATPCDSEEECDNPAVALYSKSHTLEGCWGEPVTFCQLHLTRSLRRYEAWLESYGICTVCQSTIVPGLSRNTRIVRL